MNLRAGRAHSAIARRPSPPAPRRGELRQPRRSAGRPPRAERGRARCAAALSSLRPRDEQALGGGAGARMNRQERNRAEAILRRGENRRQRVRPMDHHEPSAGGEQRETGANPGRRARLPPRPPGHAHARAPRREKRERFPRSKKGGLVTTQSAFSSASPAARRAFASRTSSVRTRDPGFESVARGVGPAVRPRRASISTRSACVPGAARPARGRPRRRPRRRRRPVRPACPRRPRASAASEPTRWPRFGWRSSSRPPSHASSDKSSGSSVAREAAGASAIAQFAGEARLGDERRARPSSSASTRMRLGRKPSDPSTAAICWSATKKAMRSAFRIDSIDADENEIIGAQDFDQGDLEMAALAAVVPPSLWSRVRGLARESVSWELSFRSKKSRAERLIEPLTALVAADMARVNQTILSRTGSDVAMIPEVANHLISSGGKRLRPILTLATAGLCGYAGEGHIKLAAAVEFMHTATLLHDDVVDESDMRRGKAAARVLWGNEASVLVGDFLLGQAFKMMVEVGSLPCLEVHVERRGGDRRGRGNAALRRQGHRDDRGRLSRRHPRQDGGPVRRRLRGRPDPRRPAEGGDRRLPRLRRQSRHRLPAHRRRARLRRLVRQARQERRRRFPRGQDHAAGRAVVPARGADGARVLAAHAGKWRRSARAISRRARER